MTSAPEASGAGSGCVSHPRAVSRSAACWSCGSGGASATAILPSTWAWAWGVSQVSCHASYGSAGHGVDEVVTSGTGRRRRRRVVGAEGRGDGRAGADRQGPRGALGDAGELVPVVGRQFGGDGDRTGDQRLAVVGDVVADVDLDGGESPALALRVH